MSMWNNSIDDDDDDSDGEYDEMYSNEASQSEASEWMSERKELVNEE